LDYIPSSFVFSLILKHGLAAFVWGDLELSDVLHPLPK
jgi:hypothetical protein